LASAFASPYGELLSSRQQAGGYSAEIFINNLIDEGAVKERISLKS